MKNYRSFFIVLFLSMLSPLSTTCYFGTLSIELVLSENSKPSLNFQVTPKNYGDFTKTSPTEMLTDAALIALTNKIGNKLTLEDIAKIELQILELEIKQQKMIRENNEKARLEEYTQKKRELDLYLNRKR